MDLLLWAGTTVGAVLGLAHATYVYRLIAAEVPAGADRNAARPAYYAAWTLGLWVLFGTYVLVLWSVGVVVYVGVRSLR